MKTTNWMMIVLLGTVLALAGCGKKAPPPPPSVEGVTVDLPKLREAFATATPDLQTAISQTTMCVRYGEYSRALDALGKLAAAPNLTDPQKKIVNEVTAQIKELASKVPAPPGH
jgi:predicted small lipoprotein YifL